MWITLAVACLAGGPELKTPATHVLGTHGRAESENFTVISRSAEHDAREAAQLCEQLRGQLRRQWCGEALGGPWTPKCELVIHGGRPDYLAAVGSGAARTFGSSLLDFGRDQQVSKRRIDLRGDSSAGMAALPHEMTHVVLADLIGRQPPRWADEGMALLADAPEKRRLHERDLAVALSAGRTFRLAELLTLETYPHPSRVPAFYGQSASLTALLAARDTPARFVEFLRYSHEHGYDAALKHVYAIESVGQLERLWLDSQ
jgi:hypothetical protein